MRHSRFPVAIHLFFLRDDSVLLLRRFNTGWEDGKYSVPAGHVEVGESVTEAAIREAREEVGADLQAIDVQVVHVMHRRSEEERVDFFLHVRSWMGELSNREPQRCDDLAWYLFSSLPENIIPYVRQGLANYQDGIPFSEFGW
jgi:8-oxo-dGTP diphosphatase